MIQDKKERQKMETREYTVKTAKNVIDKLQENGFSQVRQIEENVFEGQTPFSYYIFIAWYGMQVIEKFKNDGAIKL